MSHIIDEVGNTPCIEIPYKKPGVQIFAKCEWFNPSGSVKDRAAANMIKKGLEAGDVDGKTLIDATSGNTGIAYALYGASLGIPVELALPENASDERKLILRNYGVKLHLTSGLEATDGAQRFVDELVANNKSKYFFQISMPTTIIGRLMWHLPGQRFGTKPTNRSPILLPV